MNGHLTVLADQDCVDLFGLLGQFRRIFQDAKTWTDPAGIAWMGKQVGHHGIAITWLGSGWVFDSEAQLLRAEEYETRMEAMRCAKPGKHDRKLAEVVEALHLGRHAERLLWAIHVAVRAYETSLLTLSDKWLGSMVWGQQRPQRVRHWRSEIVRTLKCLAMMHVAPWPDEAFPPFGPGTALFNHVGDLRGLEVDECDGHCPEQPGRHHHLQVEIGPAFLGNLEQFGKVDDESGIRSYTFPKGGKKTKGPSLWGTGTTGRLVSVFLPAKLGEPAICDRLIPKQHRLLQALIRETTWAKRKRAKDMAQPEVISDNSVPSFSGSRRIKGPLPDATSGYVGFNGNGHLKRKGRGYLLASEKGWLYKAGYPLTEIKAFLDDLGGLAAWLGIVVVGIGRDCKFIGIEQMQGLALTPTGLGTLERLHVRAYAPLDYLERWSAVFMGTQPEKEHTPPGNGTEEIASLLPAMRMNKISRRELAKGIGEDPSFVNKVINRKKPCPEGLLEKMREWVAGQIASKVAKPRAFRRSSPRSRKTKKNNNRTLLDEAFDLLDQGWSVVPQLPGMKKPCVKWKPFQERLPTREEWTSWFEKWPDAGLALVLGPVSGIFVIDVDGEEAHLVLMERLGKEPMAPKALSGSGKPYRYHLYFRYPDLPTKAKQTPWHPNLEFRGDRGIVIIPPSLHKSGNRYAWAPGRSPEELDFPEVPSQVLEALKPLRSARTHSQSSTGGIKSVAGIEASRRTLAYLSGKWAEGPGWNCKLFNAACDLCGRDMALEKAEPLLLAGAQPWNVGEEELARGTIRSAFSQRREPARL